jgi:hypothetical protein
VHAAADELVGQQAEPPFDLVHPRRAGRPMPLLVVCELSFREQAAVGA